MSQGVGRMFCLPKTAWPPTSFINQYAGEFLTGLLISRGANFMHDLLGSVNNMHVNTKQGTQIQNNNVQDK